MIREFAPAKINLYLHITGRRPDGYHDLDSLTAFAAIGDELELTPHAELAFSIKGPQAAPLQSEASDSNLVIRAAKELAARCHKSLNLGFTLTKNLPVASGIGGGSSDAAAALRCLAQLWDLTLDHPSLLEVAALCGQDVPVCLKNETCYITPVGTAPGLPLPLTHIVLVNPNKGLPTVGVYKAFHAAGTGFTPAQPLTTAPPVCASLTAALKLRGNDLTAAAIQLMPEIDVILKALAQQEGCLLARMSGSGATSFGLFADRGLARACAAQLMERHPSWWVTQSHIPLERERRRTNRP